MKLTPEVNKAYFETVIFDLDGVIIDSAPDICSAVRRTLAYLDSAPRENDYIKSCIGGGARNVLRKALDDGHQELIDEAVAYFKEYYLENCTDQTQLYPGVAEILDYYSATKNITLATFKVRAATEKILSKLGVMHYFDVVVTADDVAFPKPNPQCIKIILDELTCASGTALIVGDTVTDLLTGKNAGIKTCGVLYGIGTETEIRDAKPDYILSELGQLREIIL